MYIVLYMMSSATAQRAGRAPKDKSKPQSSHTATKTPSEVAKTSEGVVSKIQPTAEQLRIAQLINDPKSYPDIKAKVESIIEITGRTSDAALVALHDCDNDSNRAAIMLLEGNQDEGKWETSGKKKKNRQVPQKTLEVNGHEPVPVEKEEKEPVENTSRRREPKQRDRGYQYHGPPRMNRGGNQGRNWRNKENEKNERNLQRGSRGPRRGRGRGGRSRTFQNRGLPNDGFPESIDTWTNSTAEKASTDTTMNVGNWSDIAVPEEWSEEDWAENLTETKVFTPSAGTQPVDIPANLDLATFLQKAEQPSFDFDQAAETIKAAVGVVSSTNSYPPSYTELPFSTEQSVPKAAPQRVKPLKARLPPPSKIPESAVVMPNDAVTSLDVQFGALQFGTDSSPFDFTSSESNTYQDLGQSSNTSSHVTNQAMPSSISSQSSYSNAMPSSVSLSKDSTYNLGSHSSPSQNTSDSQESMLMSQSEHKTVESVSSYVNHRTNQSTTLEGSMLKSESVLSSYSSSSCEYGSSPYSKSVLTSLVPTTASYSSEAAKYPSTSYASSSYGTPYSSAGTTYPSYSSYASTGYSSQQYTSTAPSAAQYEPTTSTTSVLGLVSTSSSTTTTSVLKNSLSASKAVPNIPQNMPAMLSHQYIMGQGLPFYGLQQPVYSYEDMQVLQSKLPTMSYYDMQFQAPTSMTGRDPGMGNVAYTIADGKYSRADTDASTVATTQAGTHGFLNPAATLPPGYGYYFAGGMMTGGIHHYAPPLFPVPPATNTHGATTNSQFQKANAYGSHSYNSGYEGLTQTQDYTKGTYGAASQSQVKGVSGSGAVPDLSGSVYSKAHAQLAKSYDKPGFHTGTPPPFNLAGSQAAGPSAPYATQFIPVLAHNQHHSTLLHHHLQQEGSGGTQPGGQRGPQQQKSSSKQNYATYWTSN